MRKHKLNTPWFHGFDPPERDPTYRNFSQGKLSYRPQEIYVTMADAMDIDHDTSTTRGIKRKAEDARPTAQAPKRIKVEEQDHRHRLAG